MLADAVLRLAAAALPAASRERYGAEWAAEASELSSGERLAHASRILVRTPQLRFALRPVRGRALAGGGVIGTGSRSAHPVTVAVLALAATLPTIAGVAIIVAGASLRAYCSTTGACVPLELAVPEDGTAFQAGPVGWVQPYLYAPIGPTLLGFASFIGYSCAYLGLLQVRRGSWASRFFAVAFGVGVAVLMIVAVFAPELAYVTNLTE